MKGDRPRPQRNAHAGFLPLLGSRATGGILLLGVALFAGACTRSTDRIDTWSPGLHASLSTNVLRVGDVTTLSLTWTHEPGAVLELPELDRERELVILDTGERHLPPTEGFETTVYDLRFTSFAPGEHLVSTGEVVEVTSAGETNIYAFPELPFEVASVLQGTDEEELRPARPVREWPTNPWPAILAVVAVLLLVLLLLGGYLYYARRRAARPVPPPMPTPAHKIARDALAHLEAKGYIESLLHEPFYVELSAIVRHYLENRFALHAPEQTTEEFIRETAGFRSLDPEHRRLTGEFLEQSDLVKFARHRPDSSDMQNAFTAAERLVEETRTREAPTS